MGLFSVSKSINEAPISAEDLLQNGEPGDPIIGDTGYAASTLITAGGMSFNLQYDADALAAPAAFRASIEKAAMLLSKAILNKITVNIVIHYTGTGGGASANFDNGLYESYATVRAALLKGAAPGDKSFAALPDAASIEGQAQIAVFNAQLKALGLLSANDTSTADGHATFATDIPPADLVGVAIHELTHALGRVPFGPQPDIFDLFRFTGVGTHLFTSMIPSAPAYFSVDNGQTKLADYGLRSDPSDYLNSGVQGPNDSLNEIYGDNTLQTLTGVDIEELDVLGFKVAAGTSFSIGLKNDTGPSTSDSITNDPTLTGSAPPNQTVTLFENGAVAGTAVTTADGTWTSTPTLADGQHSITAGYTDQNGQNVTATQTFVLATKAPTINAAGSVTGQTDQNTDTITAAAVAEAVGTNAIAGVEIYDGGADLGAAVLAKGLWTFTAPKLLPGAHDFKALAYDLAGNGASFALPEIMVNTPKARNTFIFTGVGFAGNGVTDIRPKGINDLGEIVGTYIDGRADDVGADGQTYYEHGFSGTISGSGRQYVSIDDPDGPVDQQSGEATGIDRTRAFAVNNNGEIVGWYSQDETGVSSAGDPYVLGDAGYIDAVKWPGTFGKLGFSALGDYGTHTLGINSTDQIVGYYTDGAGNLHGFLRNFTGYGVRGAYTPFDIPNSISTVAEGISDSGVIAGYYQTADQVYHGFSFDTVAGTYAPIDFNGAVATQALGINNNGTIVGVYTDTAGARHGFIRTGSDQLTSIDDPNAGPGGTLVGGINNAGEIVGWYTGTDGHDHGFTGIGAAPVLNDFSASGASGILLQNDNGAIVDESVAALKVSGGGLINNPGPTWHVVGSADFNGDGQDDILLQNDSGAVVDYLMSGSTISAGNLLTNPGASWHVRGTGDFNNDGEADLVLQNDNGTIIVEYTNGVAVISGTTVGNPGSGWTVEGVADFNGDGQPDLLLQNTNGAIMDYLMNGATPVAGFQLLGASAGYSIAGTGNYNADNRADILLHNDNGTAVILDTNGQAVIGGSAPIGNPGPTWTSTVGGLDFNHDGSSDILIENGAGAIVGYTLDTNGVVTGGNTITTAGAGWRVTGGPPIEFIDGTGAAPTLSGTAGVDEFNFTSFTPGIHTITNFDAAIDLIAVSATFGSYANVKAHETPYAGGTAIGLSANAAIVIQGVTPDQLTSANFVLR